MMGTDEVFFLSENYSDSVSYPLLLQIPLGKKVFSGENYSRINKSSQSYLFLLLFHSDRLPIQSMGLLLRDVKLISDTLLWPKWMETLFCLFEL